VETKSVTVDANGDSGRNHNSFRQSHCYPQITDYLLTSEEVSDHTNFSSSQLDYTEELASQTLDAHRLCQFVFSGVSQVNCWNKSGVGEYKLYVYE
jgi:hypothetical protein